MTQRATESNREKHRELQRGYAESHREEPQKITKCHTENHSEVARENHRESQLLFIHRFT